MNAKEKKIISRMVKYLRNPSCPGAIYDEHFKMVSSGDTATQINTRLERGSEYDLGWSRCAEMVAEYLNEIGIKVPPRRL